MVPINKRMIGTCIALSIVTFGIYFIYWEYLLVKNTRAIQKDGSSCTGEMLCLVLVPFYNLYWWFTRGKTVNEKLSKHGYTAKGNEIAYLVLGIFGLNIISAAIMQNDFNSLKSESTHSNQRSTRFKMPLWWLVASIRFVAPVLLAGLFGWNMYDLFVKNNGNYGDYPMWAIIWAGWVVSALVFISGFIAKIVVARKKKKGFVEDEVVWED